MGVGGQRHAPVALSLERDPLSIVQEARWAPGPVLTGAEGPPPTGIRSPDRSSRSMSLYRLLYLGPYQVKGTNYEVPSCNLFLYPRHYLSLRPKSCALDLDVRHRLFIALLLTTKSFTPL
jgi:hypothetical protein